MCVSAHVCVHAYMCVQVPQGGWRGGWVPGTTITGSCELQDVGTRNQTWVLCKSTQHSELLSHLSSPGVTSFMW